MKARIRLALALGSLVLSGCKMLFPNYPNQDGNYYDHASGQMFGPDYVARPWDHGDARSLTGQ